MKEVRAVLTEKVKRTESIESFRFKPDKKIDFLPGQFLQLVFDEKNRNNPALNKFLSFSSAPGKDYIEVTKRMSESEFSGFLRKLKPGDEVLLKAPLGNCVFKDGYAKIGFLVGGVGITPVVSILEYIISKNRDTDVCLLYSSRTERDIAFKPEIDSWSERNQRIKVVYVINKQLSTKYISDFRQRIFFIFGPPKMVEMMKNICLNAGCAKEMIKVEKFVGY